MQRIAVGVQYDGAGFRGWQTQQSGIRTVQMALEQALSKVANHPVCVICAGRTDAGVHGIGQVAHFDTTALRTSRSWILGSNAHLPPDVSVHWAQQTAADFHARFSAQSRRYRYLILNRAQRSALWRQRATNYYRPLDAQRMHHAAQLLLGEHDFSSFRAAECQARHPIRTIHQISVCRYEDFVVLEVEANAFLHHMVRNIVGVLLSIGNGEQPLEWIEQVLKQRDRTQAGVTAPADGLYLLAVHYPERFNLPVNTAKNHPAGFLGC